MIDDQRASAISHEGAAPFSAVFSEWRKTEQREFKFQQRAYKIISYVATCRLRVEKRKKLVRVEAFRSQE